MELLIADDNPLSLRFLAEAAATLGHRCDTAADGHAALALARARRYDLLLLDVRMPRLDGPAALRQLRADASAASRDSPALATTADRDAALERELRAAGFDGVLGKPLAIDELRRALDQRTGRHSNGAEPATPAIEPPLLDDAAALRSLGSADAVAALRVLFAQELGTLPQELDGCLAAADGADLRERLHRLCASAGFCGAPRLEQACRALRSRLVADAHFETDDLAELRRVAAATLQALPV